MSEETEQQLITTPLREISGALLAEYTWSAHNVDVQVEIELRYFLPRYLELIAAGDFPDCIAIEICLRRLGIAHYRERWPAVEVETINAFFDALLLQSLMIVDLGQLPGGRRLAAPVHEILVLTVTAGADIERLLSVWDRAPDPAAAVQIANLRSDVTREHGHCYFQSPFLEESRYHAAAYRLGAWLTSIAADERLSRAARMVTDPRLRAMLSKPS